MGVIETDWCAYAAVTTDEIPAIAAGGSGVHQRRANRREGTE